MNLSHLQIERLFLALIICLSSFRASALTFKFNSADDLYAAADAGSFASSETLTLAFSSSSFLLSRAIFIRAPLVNLIGSTSYFKCTNASFVAMQVLSSATTVSNLTFNNCLGAMSITGLNSSTMSVMVDGCGFQSNGALSPLLSTRASSLSLQCQFLPCSLSISSTSFTSNRGARGVVVMDQAGQGSTLTAKYSIFSLNSNSSSIYVDGSKGSVHATLSSVAFDRQYGGSGQGQGALSNVDMTGLISASVYRCLFDGSTTGDAVAGLSLVASTQSSEQPSSVSIVKSSFTSQSASLGQDPLICTARPQPISCWDLVWASVAYIKGFSHVSIDGSQLRKNSGLSNIRILNCINVSVSHSTMSDNLVSNSGGAMLIINTSSARIGPDSVFDSNRASDLFGWGGAINGVDVSMDVFNSSFMRNMARFGGGALALTASGMERSPLFFSADNVSVFNNSAACVRFNSTDPCGGGGFFVMLESIFNLIIPSFSVGRPYWRSDRIRVTNSNFANNQVFDGAGGGLLISQTGFTFSGCVFVNNSANVGGAMTAGTNASLIVSLAVISNCSFSSNLAVRTDVLQRTSIGGSIALYGNYSFSLSQCRVVNTSGAGGAVTVYGSSLKASDCYFGGNTGLNGAALISAAPDVSASIVLIRCVFEYNVASSLGGGALFLQSAKEIVMDSCSFSRNDASQGSGGAVFIINTPAIVSNSTFEFNTASAGGGFYSTDSSIQVTSSLFNQNTAQISGGGICSLSLEPTANNLLSISGSSAFNGNSVSQALGSGGAIYASVLRASISNASFINNRAREGPGVAALGTTLVVNTPSASLTCYQSSSGAGSQKLTYCNDTSLLSPPLPSATNDSGGGSLGLILGLSIGLGLVAFAAVLSAFFLLRWKRRQGESEAKDPPPVQISEPKFDDLWDPMKELEQLTASLKIERITRTSTIEPFARASDKVVLPSSGSTSSRPGSNLPDTLEIKEMIGSGGQGSVYRGRWKGAEVAIKTFVFSHKEGSNTRSEREQAILEAGVSSLMHHENVVASLHIEIRPMAMTNAPESSVQIVETGTEWKAYLVQELMDCNLTSLMERGAFANVSPGLKKLMVVCILKDIASGMAYIHDLNVVHGDMKPDNILIRRDQRRMLGMIAKITDFGLCSNLGLKTHVSNFFGGTQFYMDPSIKASGQTSKPSDVYSFGILIVELFTGQRPYLHNGDGTFLENKAFYNVLLQSMPPELASLALQCLAQDLKSRPSFDQIVSSLTSIIPPSSS